jgi:hypothetical protein
VIDGRYFIGPFQIQEISNQQTIQKQRHRNQDQQAQQHQASGSARPMPIQFYATLTLG